ncbi:uncharacterized protein LOC142165939 [Nicotiana tabacum]|uniref:Uncharacterized protein LOC142165939 n=1 Tax=Nicotiana tabacum TaxID=4097 RepID=A0AC58S629_TOBAC
MVRDRFQEDGSSNVNLKLIGKKNTDGRRYNLPTISEVVALVVGDVELSKCDRDIIIEIQSGQLQRINELNAAYLGIQYPLLFPYGEDGYEEHIPLNEDGCGDGKPTAGRKCVSMREFFVYKIQDRKSEVPTIVSKGLEEATLHGETTPSSQGKRIILLSSFTGGARYMFQNYQHVMAICKWVGYPDLFITFTCNLKCPEILRHVTNEAVDPHYYKAVKSFMMHDPCDSARKASPCIQNGRCTKHFPKKFIESTTIDKYDYPIYGRRDNGRTIKKDSIDLENRYVVPHNLFLLLKYGAYINVEWCNKLRLIKYLFKYAKKGNDPATAAFSRSVQEEGSSVVDEINMYYDCRYISPCEAAWRIFKFPIRYRQPSVDKLSFHLPNEHRVIFSDDDPIDDAASRPTSRESMFFS